MKVNLELRPEWAWIVNTVSIELGQAILKLKLRGNSERTPAPKLCAHAKSLCLGHLSRGEVLELSYLKAHGT